jgi:hypothetical protein
MDGQPPADPQDRVRLRLAHIARIADILAECQVQRIAGQPGIAHKLLKEAEHLLRLIKNIEALGNQGALESADPRA